MPEDNENEKKQPRRAKVSAQPEIVLAPEQDGQRQADRITTAADAKKLFDEEFATSLTPVYISSLGKDFSFREITVMQQKSLSRIMVANENRKDVIYDAQCQLINQACADDGFSVYNVSEFDRLKLLIALYQANMFQREVKFTCSECGSVNAYRFDFDKVLAKLDAVDVADSEVSYRARTCEYRFTIGYPSVKTVSQFHKQYCAKNRITNKNQAKSFDNMSNMEYVNLYIQGVEMTNLASGRTKVIDFRQFSPADREEIIQMFPQDVLYAEDGVLKKVMEKYVKVINDSFERHKCVQCGHVNEEGDVASAESFI